MNNDIPSGDNHEQEPTPLGELIEDPSQVVGYEGDAEREYQARLTDLQNESREYEEERARIIEEVRLHPDDAELQKRLEEITRQAVETKADLIDHERKRRRETGPGQ